MPETAKLLEVSDDAIERMRLDAYFSEITGLGGSKDRSASIDFRHSSRFVSAHTVNQLYAGDPIAARVVDVIVDDAMRAGWDLVFGVGEDGDASDLEKRAELQAKVAAWEKRVGLRTQIKHWWARGRAHGGAVLVFGADDGGDPGAPLGDAKAFDWLRVFTRWDVTPSVEIGTDPADPLTFCLPVRYQLHPSGLGDPLANVQIHASRLHRYSGILVDDPIASTNVSRSDTFGDSVFERVWAALKNWNSALQGAGHLIQDFAQAVYSIKGFRQVLRAKGGQQVLYDQFAAMETFRSMFNATVVDADDTYERKTTSVSGMPDLLDRFGHQLASASGMSLVQLLGISPGGFGTGEAEAANWQNVVTAAEAEHLLPVLERVYSVLFTTPDFRGVPDSWSIVFRPLAQRSDKDQAAIQNQQAQTDTLYLQSGVLTAEEIAQSRFGSQGFTLATSIDSAGRSDFESADEGTGEEIGGANTLATVGASTLGDVSKTALNGAQVTALVDIVARVVQGTLPAEAAVSILRISFQLSEADAQAIIDSTAGFTPTPPATEPGETTSATPAADNG